MRRKLTAAVLTVVLLIGVPQIALALWNAIGGGRRVSLEHTRARNREKSRRYRARLAESA